MSQLWVCWVTLCEVNERIILHVHVWEAHVAEDYGEVSGKLGRGLVCVHLEVFPHLLRT